MDREWQQQNGNVHDEVDLSIPSDDRDSFWNNLANVDDDDDDDNEDDDANSTDEDYTGAASSSKKKKKRRRKTAGKNSKRHNRAQTQQLEAVFLECPHPDENQRLDLAKKLGMDILQVKFWFQNRRSAKKNQLERQDNKMLRGENEALKAEHQALKVAFLKKACPTCGGPMVPLVEGSERHHLILENASLKDQLFHANAFLNKVSAGTAPMPMPPTDGALDTRAQGCALGSCPSTATANAQRTAAANAQRTALLGRVLRARDEFMMMVNKDDRMWLPTMDGEVLDYQMYHDLTFPGILGFCPMGFGANGTRDTGMVMGSGPDLVTILTDATRWREAFPGIVASAAANNIVPPTAHHGTVQLMGANLTVLSPRMPMCKVKFVRQCMPIEPNVWAVVDVSVHDICGLDSRSEASTWINASVSMACRMLPSGCLIQDMNNGYCQVTWIVNAEYDRTVVPGLYHPLLRSGHALGARRWLTSLQRRCQQPALLRSDPARYYAGRTLSAIPPEGRNSVLNLAQHMTAIFCATICGAGPKGQPWSSVQEWRGSDGVGAESFELAVRVATVTLHNGVVAPGAQAGLVVSAATTVWLPGTPARDVFDYICDGDLRAEWDTFFNCEPVQQQDNVGTIQCPYCAVSVLRPKVPDGSIHKKLLLQQVCADASCMLLAYAPAEEQDLKEVIRGGKHAFSLLPSGFVILPDGHGDEQTHAVDAKHSSGAGTSNRTNDGSLVTVLFQRLLSGPPLPENLTAQIVNNVAGLVSRSIVKIKEAVHANVVVTA